MKYIYSILLAVCVSVLSLAATVTVPTTITPSVITNENSSITVTFAGSAIDETAWGATNHQLYLWAWYYDNNGNQANAPANGTWAASGSGSLLTYNAAADTYSMTMTPSAYFGATGIGKIGFLIKNLNGTYQSQDTTANVGFFFVSSSPKKNSTSYVADGSSYPISIGTSSNANFVVTATVNGTTTTVATANNTTSIFTLYKVTGPATITVTATEATAPNRVLSETFYLDLTATTTSAAMPGWMRQGITYDPNDPTRVGLAIYAPNKAGFHVIGSFNNWAAFNNNKMQRDTANPDVFWTIVTGLTAKQIYTFQYLSDDGIRVADPFSRQILSADDDPYISATVYPGMPVYPSGQTYDVSVIQTGMPAYNWAVTNFAKPAKEKLVVYELLVRDFTPEATWASTMAKIPYLKSLGINAVELLPVMEFDGNNSWGYNPGFHFALDKTYGLPDAFKLFIDTCHQNGIAVILDIALNHASGRSPIERLWAVSTTYDANNNPVFSTTPTTDYGAPSLTNPYFNQTAKHSYSVLYDLNHSAACTKYYVNRVLEQWITEYKVDGFRWDLTKGFTQACTPSDQACTNSYQQDRVDILKTYLDYQWNLDPNSYAIFEHLGIDNEEKEWANYKNGAMMWDKLTDPYNQNTMGYNTSNDFSRANFAAHGFTQPRAMNYGESHDEERLMYKNLQYGAVNGSYSVKDLPTALARMQAYGAVFLTVPGPKMIWQFGELGYDKSIYTCSNGTVSTTGDCRTDPKPSAFSLNYNTDANRQALYNTWSKIIALTQANQIFQSTTFTIDNTYLNNLAPRIFIWDGNGVVTQALKNVVILSNFGTSVQNVVPSFPSTGTWYNLMDNSTVAVADTAAPITLQPGEFRIYGNAPSVLATTEVAKSNFSAVVAPNPVTNGIVTVNLTNAKNAKMSIFDLSGKLVGTKSFSTSTGSETLPFNFAPGLYLVQIKSDNGVVSQKVLVK